MSEAAAGGAPRSRRLAAVPAEEGRATPTLWDDPDYWEPLSDAAVELAARAFQARLAGERAGPSPLRRSRAVPSSRPA